MKNTKTVPTSIKIFFTQPLKWICIFAAFWLFCALVFVVALWIADDFNPDFLKIDGCLDNGGRWLDETRECEYADQYPEIEPYKH